MQALRATIDAQEQYLLHVLNTEPLPDDQARELGLDKHWIREEVGCLLRLPGGTAQSKLDLASTLVTRFPATLDLLADGQITLLHARRLADATHDLGDEAAARVEGEVLATMAGSTVAQFATRVRRAVLRADTRAAEQRHRDAVAERRVCFRPVEDGTTELWALLPADAAARLERRLDEYAAAARGHDDRTADQRRADALCDLTSSGSKTRRESGPAVHVTVALSTLLGLDEQPGELDRHGPIPAALARAIAFDPTGTWRRLLATGSGQLLDVGRATYRPPAHIARHVRTQHRTCVFPGCRRRAQRCELDHIVAWDDLGVTSVANLQPLCSRHHHLKHETRWRVRRLPDGTTRWTSPTGRHHDRPPDVLPLDVTSNDDPPPF